MKQTLFIVLIVTAALALKLPEHQVTKQWVYNSYDDGSGNPQTTFSYDDGSGNKRTGTGDPWAEFGDDFPDWGNFGNRGNGGNGGSGDYQNEGDNSGYDNSGYDNSGYDNSGYSNQASGNELSYEQKCQIQLDKHNQYRRKHGVPDLQLASDLNQIAQAYADVLGPTEQIHHSNSKYKGQWMGENLFWSSPPSAAGTATEDWYNQINKYNWGNSGQPGTGHFTQVVWKATKYVGFGYSHGVVVANYFPGGNIGGQFRANVPKPSY